MTSHHLTLDRTALDRTAITVSTLCVIHCLLLPVLATLLPLLGWLSEAEWLHRALVLMALPISILALLPPINHRGAVSLRLMALFGGVMLVLGAFVEALHDHETILTVGGAIMIAGAHWGRIILRSHSHHRRI